MASLKELRDRLKSIRSTKKVTSAMRVVAAAKFRSSRLKMEATRVHFEEMSKIFSVIKNNITAIDHPPFLFNGLSQSLHYFDPWSQYHERSTHAYTVLLGIITSDKGLCAGYNTGILKKARHWVEEHKNAGHKVKIFCIGKKGYEALKAEYGLYIIHFLPLSEIQDAPEKRIKALAEHLADLYIQREFDYADIAYTYFKNTLSQSVTVEGVLPLNRYSAKENKQEVYEFEPSLESATKIFMQDYFNVCLTRLLYESFTSEDASRMTAMDNATHNAQKMINQLTLTYNRSRQAHITTELIEIISGAEAV